MDFTTIPRQLIYKDKYSLEEIAEIEEVNVQLIDNMLENKYFNIADAKKRVLRCFNTSYYICTLILRCDKKPEWNLPFFCDIAYCNDKGNKIYQSFTLSLVYIFLTHTYYEVKCRKLLERLDNFLKINYIVANDPFLEDYYYKDVCNDLLKNTPDNMLIAEEFLPRAIDLDAFSDLYDTHFSWTRYTNYYKYDIMLDIVSSLGKTEEEQMLLCQHIDDDARRFYGEGAFQYREDITNRMNSLKDAIHKHYHKKVVDNQEFTEKVNELIDRRIEEITVTDEEVKEAWSDAMAKANIQAVSKAVSTGDTFDKSVIELQQQLNEAKETIKQQKQVIDDYASKFDPDDIKKKKVVAMTGRQHAILLLAILAYENRLPNARTNLSRLLCFIAGRNESTMEAYLKRAITPAECDELADWFCKDGNHPDSNECPFLADIIRQLPDKLKKDKAEKNRNKVLKNKNE